MQNKAIAWLLRPFGKKAQVVTPDAAKPVLITAIGDLLFSDFIKCICDKAFNVLTLSGSPDEVDLFKAWLNILSQYYTLTGSKEAAKYVRMVADIESINTKIMHVEALVYSLTKQYNAELCECLRVWGYAKDLTEDTYLQDIARITVELKNDRLKLHVLKLKYEEDEKKKGGTGEPKRADYIKMLVAINNHNKTTYRANAISTEEVAIMYKELIDYSKAAR